MNKIEKALNKKKREIDKLEVPEELEKRLCNALKNRCTPKKTIMKRIIKTAVLLITIILIGHNANTLAFYGKKLIGYNTVMDGNLKRLNELGKGQPIGKSYTFKNGVKVTLDGIMVDDNQLLAFYTVSAGDNDIKECDNLSFIWMTGKSEEYVQRSGQGEINEDKKEIKWITSFDPPDESEKELTWEVCLSNDPSHEKGKISFILDRNKAMGHTLKKRINKSIEVDETKIKIETILASATETRIEGEIQSIFELALDHILDKRFMSPELEIKLIANDKELEYKSSGIRTDGDGVRFDMDFAALPNDLNKLQIELVSFGADHKVHEEIKLEKDIREKAIDIQGQNIKINRVYEAEGETYITITTDESVLLSKVYLIVDGLRVELQETINDEYDKKKNGTITHTRTLRFKANGDELKLEVQRLKYSKVYNKIVDIPVN